MSQPGRVGDPRPSDSGESRPESVFGVDKLAIAFPVAGRPPAAGNWDVALYRRQRGGLVSKTASPGAAFAERWQLQTEAAGTAVHLAVSPIDSRWWCRMELNPARVWLQDGHSPCPSWFLRTAVSRAWEGTVLGELEPLVEPVDARVRRVDLAVDLQVSDVRFLLLGLFPLHRAHARYVNLRRGRGLTLELGSRSGGEVRMYDKSEQSKGSVAAGTLRWEVELKGGWLKRSRLHRFSELTVENLDRVGRTYWEWSRAGTALVPPVMLVERVERLDLSEVIKDRIVGAALRRAVLGGASSTRRRAGDPELLAEALRVALAPLADDLFAASSKGARRLELDQGREVHGLIEREGST